jgi:hypothetical protein
VNAIVADVFPVAVAVPIVGAPGTLADVTLLEAALGALVPAEFVAVTVNVYAVLAAKPLTVTVPEPA